MIFPPMKTNYNSDIFSTWTNREIEALKKATKTLQAQQPPPPSSTRIRTGVVGCHYHKAQACFIINAMIDGKKVYAGRMDIFDKEKAIAMQQVVVEKHKQINKHGNNAN